MHGNHSDVIKYEKQEIFVSLWHQQHHQHIFLRGKFGKTLINLLTRMVDRLGEVNVTKVAGTLSHVAGTGLTAAAPVHGTLSGVHQATQLRSPALVYLEILQW